MLSRRSSLTTAPRRPPSRKKRMNQLDEADVARAREMFAQLDSNGDGFLDTQEIVEALKGLGHDAITLIEVKELMAPHDKDMNGGLDLRELMRMIELNSARLNTRKNRDVLDTEFLCASLVGIGKDASAVRMMNPADLRVESQKLESVLHGMFGLEHIRVEEYIQPPITYEKLVRFLTSDRGPAALVQG